MPYKLQPGNVNYELAWGCAGIPDYLDALGRHHGADPFEVVAAQEEALAERLLAWLRARNDVRIVGRRSAAREERVPTVSFVAAGRRSSAIVEAVGPPPGRHPLRRILRPPPDRGSSASPSRTASSASRWSTTTRSTRSTG